MIQKLVFEGGAGVGKIDACIEFKITLLTHATVQYYKCAALCCKFVTRRGQSRNNY